MPSLLAPTAPSTTTSSDHGGISLGIRYTINEPGTITSILWFVPVGWDNSAAAPTFATLYSQAGSVLAQATAGAMTAGQFHEFVFTSPVAVNAGDVVVAAVWLQPRVSGSDYGATPGRFSSPLTNGPLTGTTGLFDYSNIAPSSPGNTSAAWYGVDVVWNTAISIPEGFPTPETTGPAEGVTLTDYSGPASIPAGEYEGVRFPALTAPSFYSCSGNDTTFRDCEFEGSGLVHSGDRLVIERCSIEGGLSLTGVSGAVVVDTRLHGSPSDLLHITSDSGRCQNIVLRSCCLDSPVPDTPLSHSDGIQVRGVDGLLIDGCTVDMGPWFEVEATDVLNSAVFLQNANGGSTNVEIRNSYLNGAGTTFVASVIRSLVLTGNVFGNDFEYSPVGLADGAGADVSFNNLIEGDPLPDSENTVRSRIFTPLPTQGEFLYRRSLVLSDSEWVSPVVRHRSGSDWT